MPPKRKPNNTKKRRAKPEQGIATTPTTSPSKLISADNSTQSTPNQPNHSSPTTPSKPTSNLSSQTSSDHSHDKLLEESDHLNRASKPSSTAVISHQNDSSDHQSNDLPASVNSTANNLEPVPLSERSTNMPQSNSSNQHPSNEIDRPNKSNKDENSKQTSAAHRLQGPGELEGENHPDPVIKSKAGTKKSHQVSNKPSTNSHSDVSQLPTQHHHPGHPAPPKVASDPVRSQNGVPKESGEGKPTDREQPETLSVNLQENMSADYQAPATLSVNSEHEPSKRLSNSGRKPAKHVKFTNAAQADQSSDTPRPEGEQKDHRRQARPETDEHADSHTKHKPIRREMSGAADQFDFDAQQRLHAGPGGGTVKKPCHRRPNGTSNHTTDHDAVDEPREVSSSDQSSTVSHEESSHPNRDTIGFHHAQRCLQSIVEIQHLNVRPDDLDPDLLQIYLSYFDLDQDGLLDPLDTCRAFRRLGFGLLWAAAATLTLHALFSPFIGMGSWLVPDILGRCQLPLGHRLSGSARTSININPHDILHVDKDHIPDKIGPSALWKKTQEHMGAAEMTDPIGWLKFVIGWLIAISLTWPSDLCVKHDLINGVYNGELFFLVAQDLPS